MSTSKPRQWSLLSQRVIAVSFHLLLLIVPFAFTWVNDELFEFNKIIVTYLIAVVIIGAWIIRMVNEERIIFRRTSFDLPIALFLISQLLSTIFSMHPYTSFFGYYSRFHGGLLSIITYITLYYAFVSNISLRSLPRYLLSLSLAAVGVTAYALPEHFGHSPSCLLITNGQGFGVDCWIQDVKTRIFGTFGQPNWLAAYAITLIPVTLSLSLKPLSTKPNWLKWLYGLTSVLLFVTVLFTRSRSGFGGLGLGLAVFGLGLGWLFLKQKLSFKSSLPMVAGLGTSWILALAIFGSVLTPRLSELFHEPIATPDLTVSTAPDTMPAVNRLDLGGTDSGEIRKIVWQGAWDVFRRYPILGSGVETFAYSYYLDRPLAHNLVSEWDFLYNKAHNEFLNYLATTGIVGLLTYVGLLLWFGWVAIRVFLDHRQPASHQLLALGLLSAIIALTVSNYYGFSTVMVTVLMFLYLAWLELLRANQQSELEATGAENHQKFPASLQTGQVVGVSLTLLIVLYMTWSVITMWTADAAYTKGKQYFQASQPALGLEYLQQAVQQSPQEALFYDELANSYAGLAAQFAQQQDATSASQLAQAAIAASETTLKLNPRHLNFYKSQVRVYISLAELQPDFLNQAQDALVKALELAPTDAKLMYNLALVQVALGEEEQGLATLEKTIEMKANYLVARSELAKKYEQRQQWPKAIEQYQAILKYNPNDTDVKARLKVIEASVSAQIQK